MLPLIITGVLMAAALLVAVAYYWVEVAEIKERDENHTTT